MNTTRKIAAYALTAVLLGGSAGGAFAQTSGTGGSNTTAPAATSGQTTNRDNDRGWDWGWLGLIGLAGLAGLMRRDRTYPETTHRSGVGTTSTAAR